MSKWAVPSALALAVFGWLALEPWRPILEGDEWGYFESIDLTVRARWPVVSDWLNPTTVGLTTPAAVLSVIVGNPWLGGALTLGALGCLGLLGFRRLLAGLSLDPLDQARGILALAFFPVFLAGWVRLGSGVPAFSLMCLSLSLLLPCLDTQQASLRPLLLAAAIAAWAVSIRQNHLALVAAGALALARSESVDRRTLRLFTWVAPPLLSLVALRLFVAPSFAQQEFGEPRLARLLAAPRYFALALFGGLCFSSGCATLLTGFVAPRRMLRLFAGTPKAWYALSFGLLSALALAGGLVGAGFWANDGLTRVLPSAFNATSQQSRVFPAALSALGAASLGGHLFAAWRSARSPFGAALALSAAAYLAGAAGWGYADYYFLDPIVLLCLIGLNDGADRIPRPSERLAAAAALCLCVAGSWHLQRSENDHKAAQLRIVEFALRDGLADASALDGAPFGLIAWDLFPRHVEQWKKDRIGHPAAFWERGPASVPRRLLRLRCSPPSEGRRIVSAGRYRAGFEDVCWSLIADADSPDKVAPAVPHRWLPLDLTEWSRSLDSARRE